MSDIKYIELQPNRNLLTPNFEGYKLSLDSISKIKFTLSNGPDRVTPIESQYSFLHAQLFSLQNHLIPDPWHTNSAYFIDANWTVQKIKYNEHNGSFDGLRTVFTIPRHDRKHGDYNYSLRFVSEKYCLLGDGQTKLMLIDTGDRYNSAEWKTIYSSNTVLNSANVPSFLIEDAKFEIRNEVRQIHCILLHICQLDHGFEAILDWIQLKQDAATGSWDSKHIRQLKGKSLPSYCFLEPKLNSLIISADRPFEWVFDVENPLPEPIDDNIPDTNNDLPFTWTQDEEEVIVHFVIGNVCEKQDFKIVCDSGRINVVHKENTLLNAVLFEKIESGLTTWNLENELLQVTMIKVNADTIWTSLLKDQQIDATEVPATNQREMLAVSNLHTDIEDCDFGDGDSEREYSLGII